VTNDALNAFCQEHARCGVLDSSVCNVLDGGVEDGHVWAICRRCGATFGESGRWQVIRYLERLYALPARAHEH
jgi:hypothetical protein